MPESPEQRQRRLRLWYLNGAIGGTWFAQRALERALALLPRKDHADVYEAINAIVRARNILAEEAKKEHKE